MHEDIAIVQSKQVNRLESYGAFSSPSLAFQQTFLAVKQCFSIKCGLAEADAIPSFYMGVKFHRSYTKIYRI